LLDRFGLSVEVRTPQDLGLRVQVVRRRDAFDRDPVAFRAEWDKANRKLRQRIVRAQKAIANLKVDDDMLMLCATMCHRLGTDGLRAELTLLRATRAYAALMGDKEVLRSHLRAMAPLVLRHRLRRNPLDDTGSGVRVQRAIDEVLAA
jgi:magnesium chelatase subunit I